MAKKKKKADKELKIMTNQLVGSAVILVSYFILLAVFYVVVGG